MSRDRAIFRRALTSIALLGALASFGCRKDKAPPRLQQLDGESAVLPRVSGEHDAGALRSATRSVESGGLERRYLLLEPSELAPGKAYPLVLVFHGDGGNAVGLHHAWPFERATGNDAIVAYLDGRLGGWDLETTKDNRDVAFVERVVDAIAKDHAIDHARIFGTGYSSGGFFANVVACHRPGFFRAIASNAGGAPYNQLETWPNGYPKCPGQAPTAALALHGARDFTVTLDSGRFTAEYWAYVNGCRESEIEPTGYPECTAYRGCPSGKSVAFCSIPPLGHWVWDKAAEASWTFFQRQ